MSKTHLVIPDQHAHPDHHNERALWLSRLIVEVKPDVVVNIGDAADLPSLSSYDKGKASFSSRNYERDIDAHLDFQEKLWSNVYRQKKRLPRRVFLEGNHEHRIKKVLEYDPHLAGSRYGLSFDNLDLETHYDDIVEYRGSSPGSINIDGVTYAHYMVSGLMGRPIGGEHHAHSLVQKNLSSVTVGHSHCLDYHRKSSPTGTVASGLVVGCYQDYKNSWSGAADELWWSGVAICRNVDDGDYDLETVSIDRIRKEYA